MTTGFPATGTNTTKRTMALLWFAFTCAYISFFYVFGDAREIADSNVDGYLEVILLGIPSVVLLAGVVWVHESETDTDLRPRMVGWTVGMAGLFVVSMYTALFVIETTFDAGEQWLILLFAIGFGASAGTMLGIVDVSSKYRERQRNHSLEIARQRERERDQLEYLNQYLRHEVLNEAAKIISHTELLERRTEIGTEHGDTLRTIHDSGDEIATFIESIRTILDASNHEPELSRTDVRTVLQNEVTACQNTYPSVTIDLRGPETAYALGGDLLNRVFRNLIENAIEHNGRDVSIEVSITAGEEWIEVTVRDDGAGIPATARETLFDPPESGDHGYGLFLTRNLVEVYGGRLELAETGPDGTAFVVHLPADSATSETTSSATVASKQTAG